MVRGGYSLVEPDGTTRVVEYIADDHGFRAVVKKLGTPIHPAPVVHQPAPVVAPAPAPQPIVVEEPQPVLYDGYDAYNGHYENYVPALPEYAPAPQAAPVQIPKVVVPQVYQAYQPAPAPAPIASYFPVQKPVEERVEYHGFTGNDDDDSAYTKYGQDESGEQGYGRAYYEETRPQLISVPYKFAADYQKPILYYLQHEY